MQPTILVASLLSGVSLAFLAGLIAVWVRNYRTFGSGLTLGLLAFAAVLFVENGVAIYFFFSTDMLYAGSPAAQYAVVTTRALQLLALAFLSYVTMK